DAEHRDQAAADEGGTERDVVRLACRQTREIKCHRVRQGGPDTWHWSRSDVTRRRFADCGLESERGWAFAQGQRGRKRRFLSVPGRADRGGRSWRNLRDSAGRFGS